MLRAHPHRWLAQGSDAWHSFRSQLWLTSSRFGDVVGVGYVSKRRRWLLEVLKHNPGLDPKLRAEAEAATQAEAKSLESISWMLEAGLNAELPAIQEYCKVYQTKTRPEHGSYLTPDGHYGASPDAIIDDGSGGLRLLEIKHPARGVCYDFPKLGHVAQMLGQLACFDGFIEYCDYWVWCGPGHWRKWTIRWDAETWDWLHSELIEFHQSLLAGVPPKRTRTTQKAMAQAKLAALVIQE